jgi:hypothetical protein
VPEGLTAAGAPPAPAPPLTREPASASAPAHPWRRAIAIALLVLVAGGALGAAGFAAEQRAFVWKPQVTATANGGWRVTGPSGLRPTAPSLAGGHLVWGQGPYTCVLELDSGDSHVVGAAPRGTSIWPPAAGERYVAWIERPRSTDGPSRLWVYDTDRGRRQSFAAGAGAATTAVTGDLVVWYEGGSPGRVLSLDMRSGERATIAEGDDVDYPVLAGDGMVGWLRSGPEGSAPSVAIHDLKTGQESTVVLAADGSGVSVGDIEMAGATLIWTLGGGEGTSLVVHDVPSRVSRVAARGAIEVPATDGQVVLWAAKDDTSGTPVIRGLTLADDTGFELVRPSAWPTALAVGSGWLAWAVADGSWSYLETQRLPQ